MKVSPDFIINQQSLNKSVGSEILNKIISRGYIEKDDLNKVITTRENGKTYVVDSETGERILADSGLLLSQEKSRYEIANDRFKRIDTNKRVGLTGVVPVYKVLSVC